MKIPKRVLLKLKIAAAKAGCERNVLNFYPKWILPTKALLVSFAFIYLTLLFVYRQNISFAQYITLMNLLLVIGTAGVLSVTLKKIMSALLGYLKINSIILQKINYPVTVVMKLGFDKRINMLSINSVLNQNYKNIELILLSNIKTKYSDFDKKILKNGAKGKSKIKVSLIYSSSSSEIELLNIGIKTAAAKIIAIVKSYTVLEKPALFKAVCHLSDKNTAGVVGREIKNTNVSFGSLTEIFDGLKFNYSDELLVNSNGLLLFNKEESGAVNFVSLGINKIITAVINQSDCTKKFVYDPDIKTKMTVKNNLFNRMNKIVEINLLKFDFLLQQWNRNYTKGNTLKKKLRLNFKIFAISFYPLMVILYSLIFIITALVTDNFEYIFYIALVLIITNFFMFTVAIAVDFSITKYILQSTLLKWFTDFVRLSLKMLTTNRKIFNSSLIYIPMRK